ncbi:succinyl-CoA ligase subunit beta [Thecamonas trahens ATCC 50062]|uniref:Succinate--CoA ligase [ADP-forming] subunit beta, mitochondrial n=1 Tax=Thecamonas trahens ATCC 50062 TaxID=461836 RepID=A0A0L0DHI6_THETB|nr:succinyl-CoA ligase subunit beta [Thecamonas trahens ATCC 50062]KNC51777.1 succinyl-CoA ligase subunit beta [Thecamonas trahens ATCC 50062]|eukprot:XP_013755650.1 succinyl-CoA ligase subunit beta [Thecamonas trahens ATCC 50062]
MLRSLGITATRVAASGVLGAVRPPSSSLLFAATAGAAAPSRSLSIHEHLSHQLLREAGVSVPRGGVAFTPDEAVAVADELPGDDVVIKAQVLAGGRGLGLFENGLKGGVHIVFKNKLKDIASKMLGGILHTQQTPPGGLLVNRVMLAERLMLEKEVYFAVLMDRQYRGPVMVASSEGGVEIEKVAAETPDLIFKEPVDIREGVKREQVESLAAKLGFEGDALTQAADNMERIYEMFIAKDCTMVEINPMAKLTDGRVLAMDAKVNFDDNASFRQADIFGLEDKSQVDPREVEATKYDLNYIGLDGNVACLVNGAGLAMATMDQIALHGGEPANFLDVGGGATAEQIAAAFKIITSDKQVKVILVNIFGGIMQCNVVAEGILQGGEALRNEGIELPPVVVRLQGTNQEEGARLLNESDLGLIAINDLDKAAYKAATIARIAEEAELEGFKAKFTLQQ